VNNALISAFSHNREKGLTGYVSPLDYACPSAEGWERRKHVLNEAEWMRGHKS
jgi:hypothetical protein